MCYNKSVEKFQTQRNKMLKLQNLRSKAGFTLIELLVVIAIIALLASIVLVSLNNAREKSRNVKRVSDMTQLQKALELYYADNNTYPTSSVSVALSAWSSSILVPKYLKALPATVLPADQGCTAANNDYTFRPNVTGTQYTTATFMITFCISGSVGTIPAGPHTVTNLLFQ